MISLRRFRLRQLFGCIVLFALLTGSVSATEQSIHIEEELPPEMAITKLPPETYLRVVRGFRNGVRTAPDEWIQHGASLYYKSLESYYEAREGEEWKVYDFTNGGKLLSMYAPGTTSLPLSSAEPMVFLINFPFRNSPPLIATVADFHNYFGHYLHLVYHNPANSAQYEGLPDDVVTDLVMAKITGAIKQQAYQTALPYFVYLERRKAVLPESFWYYYTVTSANLKDADRTRALGTKYLSKYGRKGKYYDKIISLMAQ